MTHRKGCLKLTAGLWACAQIFVQQAHASPARFTVDSAQTQITLSGTAVYSSGFGQLSAPISTQAPGSLTTSYDGFIEAGLNGSLLQFPGGSAVAAQTNGTWQPAAGGASGSAPADYGAKVTIIFITLYAAVRNIVLDLASDPITLTNGNFASSNLVFVFPTNSPATMDYNDYSGDQGAQPIVGAVTNTTAAMASLTTTGAVQTLTIPVSMSFVVNAAPPQNTNFNGSTLFFSGQIVANRTLPPTITSLLVTNHTATVTVTNATLQAQLQVSTNLSTWSGAGAAVTNASGLTIFTVPIGTPIGFFRVEN